MDEKPDQAAAVTSRAVDAAASHGFPVEALDVFARWWQLERWLRSLVYLELRAKYGATWNARLPRAEKRAQQQSTWDYMASPEGTSPINYMEVSDLFRIIADHWDIFGYALLRNQSTRDGRVEELAQIRHRLAHCRIPHDDDQARIEQILRDLVLGMRTGLRIRSSFKMMATQCHGS